MDRFAKAVLCLIMLSVVDGFMPGPKRILITGGGGKTGQLVFDQLNKIDGFEPVGMVRSKKKMNLLKKKYGARDDQVIMGDIMEKEALENAMEGCYGLVIASSAVPVLLKRSLFKIMGKKLMRSKDIGKPQFKWSVKEGYPEKVDYEGQVLQFDAAKAAGVEKVIVVSSMGGTQPDNFLNSIGKKEDGTEGDILVWKRKAEEYLIASGLPYGIIHPGGLTDKPAKSRKLILDVDDKLLQRKKRQIYRGDVASLCVTGLSASVNFSLDCISEEIEDGPEGLENSSVALCTFLDKDVAYKY